MPQFPQTRLLHAFRPTAAPALIALLLVVSAGCDSTQRGRIDVYETTEAETYSDRVLPVALTEFSDQVPQALMADLAMLPEFSGGTPKTILLGDLDNQTQIVPTTDFEMMAQRIRNQLINSRVARDRMRFVERRKRIERLADRERVVTDTETGTFDTGDYDAQDSYWLLGDFYRVNRKNVNQYYMQFQLVHAATNEIVFSDRYDVKQVN